MLTRANDSWHGSLEEAGPELVRIVARAVLGRRGWGGTGSSGSDREGEPGAVRPAGPCPPRWHQREACPADRSQASSARRPRMTASSAAFANSRTRMRSCSLPASGPANTTTPSSARLLVKPGVDGAVLSPRERCVAHPARRPALSRTVRGDAPMSQAPPAGNRPWATSLTQVARGIPVDASSHRRSVNLGPVHWQAASGLAGSSTVGRRAAATGTTPSGPGQEE